ncbi:hypothetical protein [Clostridium weizhouense]|nr:hypothetical protein [Clostridium weizhouense]
MGNCCGNCCRCCCNRCCNPCCNNSWGGGFNNAWFLLPFLFFW